MDIETIKENAINKETVNDVVEDDIVTTTNIPSPSENFEKYGLKLPKEQNVKDKYSEMTNMEEDNTEEGFVRETEIIDLDKEYVEEGEVTDVEIAYLDTLAEEPVAPISDIKVKSEEVLREARTQDLDVVTLAKNIVNDEG